jgi:PAS domain S-box-containing protein
VTSHVVATELASNLGVLAVAAAAFSLLRTWRGSALRYLREIATGGVFGGAAVSCVLLQQSADPALYVNDAVVAVGVAAPFGGRIVGCIAALIAASALLSLHIGPTYLGLAQVCMAALIGIVVSEIGRRSGALPGLRRILGLPPLLVLTSAVLLLPTAAFEEIPVEIAQSLALRVLIPALAFGVLLWRWGDAELRIGEAERRWRVLVANVPGAVFHLRVGPTGEMAFDFLSGDATRLFGDGAAEAANDPAGVLRSIHREDIAAFKRSLIEAGRALSPWSHEFRVLDSSGKPRWLRARALPLPLPNGDVLWDGIIVNVTTRKEVEQALRQSEALYRLLAENTTEVIARIDGAGRWVYLSPPVRQILGYEPAELIGRAPLSIVATDDRSRVESGFKQLGENGAARTLSYRAARKDGTYITVEDTRHFTSRGAAGPVEIISVIRPLSRKTAEPTASRAQAQTDDRPALQQFAQMVEATNVGIVVLEPNKPDIPIAFTNAGACAISGYAKTELVGRSWASLHGPETSPATIAAIRDALGKGRPISTTLLVYRKDGTPLWIQLDLSPVRDGDGWLDAYVMVFVDISEQKRIESELRSAWEAAEQANRAKSDFIANISHELRTPLNGVIGFTNLLLNENLPAEQRRYATFAHDAGSSLLAIVNNVLDLSKIEAGKLDLVETDFSVVELAVSCNTVVWHAAREKGLDLNFVLKPDVVNLVRGDPNRIRQVLLNLLSNAIKFTEKGNVVLSIAKVEDTADGTVLKFSVTDTGLGIAKEHQARLFQKFSQVDRTHKQYTQGTGLGLAICKKLVELMGGTIGVISTPGLGSSFWFTVPLKAAQGSPEKEPAISPPVRAKARILVAEDVPMNQELLVTLLRRAGHEVEVVGDGLAAVEAVERKSYDLVLMDVQMPAMDGLEATRRIRALPGECRDVPIIAMTARALSADFDECFAAGMDDYLSKPVDAAALLATIDRWTRDSTTAEAEGLDEPPLTPALVEDAAVVRDLERYLGREQAANMVATAREEIPRRIKQMAEHIRQGAAVEREAHELISVAGNVGFLELAQAARALVQAARGGEGADIKRAFAALEAAADRALHGQRAPTGAAQ